jgi:hypothetical protein
VKTEMKNWMTSLFGILAGAAGLFANGLGWKQVLVALATAALGLVAKDSNVTGGTINQ